jgi:16S rRNA (cytosine967-C5)-methyltransferase
MGKPQDFDPVRMLAWNLLQRIERSSSFADLLLDRTFSRNPGLRPLDRAIISEMVLGTLRWQGRLEAFIQSALKTRDHKMDPRLLHLLRLGAYQILFMDRVPDSAAVNESVRLSKAVFQNEKIAGFVNAILRSISRNKDLAPFPPFQDQPVEYIAQALSHPRWLVERWVGEFGPEITERICTANNRKPPFTVRANTLKISREKLREQFSASGISSYPAEFSPEGLVLEKSPSLAEEGLFQKGLYFVQDEASQMIAHLLNPEPGDRVLDACSAPGGKSTHLAQLMKDRGEILALDLHGSKVRLIRENCARLGISIVRAIEADVARVLPFSPGDFFDRVLLDAPCTGLGILHRNPEAKWRRKPEDLARLPQLQTVLLDNVSCRLKAGGILVYSTCTMAREENDGVVGSFLAKHPDFALEDLHSVLPGSYHPLVDGQGFLRTYPEMITRNGGLPDGWVFRRPDEKGEMNQDIQILNHRGHSAAKPQPNITPTQPSPLEGEGEGGGIS